MEFYSVLFPKSEDYIEPTLEAPTSLKDLHLDQLFAYIFDDKYEYNLKEFYFTKMKDPNTISYRQEIFNDLLNDNVRQEIKLFSEKTGYLKKKAYLSLNWFRKGLFLPRGPKNRSMRYFHLLPALTTLFSTKCFVVP